MTQHKPVLTNEEMHALICGNPFTLGLSIARLKDFIRQVEKAVVDKLHEQEPLAWYVNNDITFDQQTADSWKKNLFIVKPLYAHPVSASTIESTLEQEVLEMVRMLEAREWADHVGQSDLGKRLEWVISTLHNELSRPQACVSPTSDKTVCDSQNTKCATQTNYQANPGSSKYCDGNLGLGLARYQPCGCMVCYCENQNQCLGCGAKHCGTHDLGEIPNPVYTNHFAGVRNMAECAKCGHPAIHYLVMDNLGYPNKTPFCGDCTQEHEQLAQDTNEHEIRNFGGAYGLVAYHYEPLGATQPDHFPDVGKMVVPHGYRLVSLADIDTAIQRASVFDDGGDGADPESARSCIEILKSMISSKAVDSLEPKKEVVHDRHTGKELLYIPPVGESLYSMAQARKESFSLALSVDTKEVQTLLQSYLDSLEGWQLVPREISYDMRRAVYFSTGIATMSELMPVLWEGLLDSAPKYTGENT